MKCTHSVQGFVALLLLVLTSDEAYADGGVIRLRETQGPFVITIFTASEPLQDGPVDLSVVVQRRDSSDPILDAAVDLMFITPPASAAGSVQQMCGQSRAAFSDRTSESRTAPFVIPATRKQASNKLLYAAPITLGISGAWRLEVFVTHGSDAVKVACAIPIGSPPHPLTALFPYLALPPLMVALFAINQSSGKKKLEKNAV